MSEKHQVAQPTLPLRHALPVQIRFADYDVFGHVNNNAYMAYFDLGKSEYFAWLLGSSITEAAQIGAVVVNINTNFYAPAVPGEPLEVRTRCTRLGDRSFVLEQQIVNPATASVKADARSVMAGFDVASQAGAEIPPHLRSVLEPETH